MRDDYVRSATVVNVIDGDTFTASVDLGFFVTVRMSCRLAGINAPEHNEPGGPEARTALATILGLGPVTIRSVRVDKYAGRFDADVIVTQPPAGPGAGATIWDAAGWLIQQGYAVPWNGTGPKPHVPWPPAKAPAGPA